MCGGCRFRVLGRRLNTHQGMRPRRSTAIATTINSCRDCGLVFSNPRPVPTSIGEHYDRPPEDYWTPDYFEGSDQHFREQVGWFHTLWTGRGKPRALDVGAGIGKTMDVLEREGFDTYGLEPSPPFRERAIARGIRPERLSLSSIEQADYGRDAFDLVVFNAVLEHLHDPAAGIEHALRWVGQDGLLSIQVPSARWLLARLLNAAYRAQGLDYVTNLSPMHPPYHLYEFTAGSFERHGQLSGYRVVARRWYVCQTFVPPPLDTVAERIMDSTRTGMQLEVWLARTGLPTCR